jgi:hypothetical protein
VPVLEAVLGRPGGTVLTCRSEPITGSTGAATSAVTRLSGSALHGGVEVPFSVVRKELRPVRSGRHAPYAGDPRHWAYWRREPLAYASGLLPSGPGLAAPRCYGVGEDVVYLADVAGQPESPRVAARRLGAWQARTPVPDVPWLAGHQLAQRLAASEWTPVDADPRVERLWRRQDELLAELARLPVVLSHGDFSAGNLIASADMTVVLDWGTLGAGPVGADLAALRLSTFTGAVEDPGKVLSAFADPVDDYLAGAGGRFRRDDVELGYRATLALTGAGRIHWMLTRGIRPPDGYEEFILSRAG